MACFIERYGHVYCFSAHTAQSDPKDRVAEGTDFMNIRHTLLEEPVRDKG